MKKNLTLLVLSFLFTLSAIGQIEKPKPQAPVNKPIVKSTNGSATNTQNCVRLAHCNIDTIIKLLPEFKLAMTNIDLYTQMLTGQYAAKQKEFDDKYQTYQDNQLKWTEPVKQSKEEELLTLQQNLTSFSESAQTDLSNKTAELSNPIYSRVNNAAAKVALQLGYDYVMDSSSGMSGIIFASSSFDITVAVMKELGISYPTK